MNFNRLHSILGSRYPIFDTFTIKPLRRLITTKSQQKEIEESYRVLNIPKNSSQEEVKKAFLELAKKYHPDSMSPEADIDKFVMTENAFRTLSKLNTGSQKLDEIEQVVYDIRHTAPQHRQYLSFDGVGYGTPSQRQQQYTQARAQKAAANVLEHRISKAIASDKTLMKKESVKHDIKTKYGLERLVEDLIQESMSKGEFENLSGQGKPLKDQNTNPYVDFTTHKINEVLINNGFTPEWITMSKEIDADIELLKEEISKERMYLGPHPLNDTDQTKWQKIYDSNKLLAESLNFKINTYNLIVPLLNKQKFHVEFDKICQEILVNGKHSMEKRVEKSHEPHVLVDHSNDILGEFFKGLGELLVGNEKHKFGS
ncbi:dnaJ homolog subfamily C member 28 [Bicyclus anynana]|uniref:DnaJ homolog subfamily C member 28 n=1 Tax=Bicyclus anynana TaxID=110368 RepID=A0A6J1MQU1_BICAN|nr:dnaJ homolog subfamily C member 28 [Bicyclus anynana]